MIVEREEDWSVTYGVDEGVSSNLGGTTASVVDIVALQGDHVAGSIEINAPVCVAVTGSRVVSQTVDVVVGDRDTVVGISSKDDVLAANASGGHVIDPDHIDIVKSDSITTPDVLFVNVGDGDVPEMHC